MAQKVRLVEEGGLRKIGGWHKKFPLSKPEKKCWMATMACAAEFQEAESFLTEKTTPLHANAPERPKTG